MRQQATAAVVQAQVSDHGKGHRVWRLGLGNRFRFRTSGRHLPRLRSDRV